VNLSKTTAAGGSLIKIPLCTMGRQMGAWESDARKLEATVYVLHFILSVIFVPWP